MLKFNKQRNYRRNADIVYHLNQTKKNALSTVYTYDDTVTPTFTLNQTDGNLYYNTDDESTESNQSVTNNTVTITVSPYAYLSMFVNDDLDLIADVPDLISDTTFEITNGDLIINI